MREASEPWGAESQSRFQKGEKRVLAERQLFQRLIGLDEIREVLMFEANYKKLKQLIEFWRDFRPSL
jgi:hypothetical protein